MPPFESINWYIGTIGFSYADWKGVFYPQGLSPRNYLSYYSRVFKGVEIDSSFYGVPRKEVIVRWNESSPQDFRFCIKAPYSITHQSDALAALRTLEDFFEALAHFGGKLGAVLFQFPPSFHADEIQNLERFLRFLPRDFRVALEFRHPSWYQYGPNEQEPLVASLLRGYAVCWVSGEHPRVPAKVHPTSDFLYLRWIGKHGTFQSHHYERIDRRANMDKWKSLILKNAQTVREVFGFFSNDYAGCAAQSALKMLEVLGLAKEPLFPLKQERLF